MQTLTAKTCLGLPSLQLQRKGPRKCSRGTGPLLQRTWTFRRRDDTTSSTAVAAFPFMEISVSVMDTLDLLKSSVEEEIVFQATMQIPAHHAITCRIEAFDTPFAQAPDLRAAPGPEAMTEQEKQFAACLASPAELEEAHSFTLQRQAETSFLQRSAPSLRMASGVLSVSFSLRHRSNSVGEDDKEPSLPGTDGPTDDMMLPANSSAANGHQTTEAHPTAAPAASKAAGPSRLQYSSSSSSSNMHRLSSSSGPAGRGALGSHRPGLTPACTSIPEDPAPSAAAAAAAAAGSMPTPAGARGRRSLDLLQQQQQQLQQGEQDVEPCAPVSRGLSRALLRVESITERGRSMAEVPLTTQLANKGVATLLGLGYMMMSALQSRTDPATTFLQYQVQGMAAGKPTHYKTSTRPVTRKPAMASS